VHHTAYEELEKFSRTLPIDQPLQIADVGAYDVSGMTLRPLFEKPPWRYQGLDIEPGPNVDFVIPLEGEWHNIPPGAFDIIVSVSTLEHTRRPWLVMQQIARVLKPGGVACICAPYAWGLHRHPIDCWRIFPDGMQTIVEDAGLKIRDLYMRDASCPEVPQQGDTIAVCEKPI
jgi:SAM-dependent methyltransferase